MTYIIQIIEYGTGRIEKEFEPIASEHMADKVDNGVNINLDHERFYTLIKNTEEKETTP